MKLRRQSNAVYCCEYHIVLPTKYRRKIFNDGVFAYLKILIKEFESYYPEVEILRINHDVDNIHILASIPPKISVGKVIGILKANTSSKIRNKYEFIRKAYYGGGSIWSGGYLYQQ